MPKTSEYPRLRTHIRKGKGGRVYVYYFYDMRPDGLPDKPLGKDRDAAIAKWEELHLGRPRVRGRLREAIRRWLDEELPNYGNAGTRRNYQMHLERVDAVLGMMTWADVTLLVIKQYLKNRRNAKDPSKPAAVQANREMAALQIVWNWARQTPREGTMEAYTTLSFPAAGLERSGWKNREQAREIEVRKPVFDAIYDEAFRCSRRIYAANGTKHGPRLLPRPRKIATTTSPPTSGRSGCGTCARWLPIWLPILPPQANCFSIPAWGSRAATTDRRATRSSRCASLSGLVHPGLERLLRLEHQLATVSGMHLQTEGFDTQPVGHELLRSAEIS